MESVNIMDEIAHWETIEALYQKGIKSGAGSVNPGFCYRINLQEEIKNINDSAGRSDDNGWNDLQIATYARRIIEKLEHEGHINGGCSDGYGVSDLDMAREREAMAAGHIKVIQKLEYLKTVKSSAKTNFVSISINV